MLNPLSNVISISMEAEIILAVAPPVIFKICFPFRNSFLLSRSPIVSFGLPFTILVFISLPVKTVRGRHNMTSLMPASAMFDLRKNISEFAEKKTRRKSNLHFYFFFVFFGSAGRRNNFSKNYCLIDSFFFFFFFLFKHFFCPHNIINLIKCSHICNILSYTYNIRCYIYIYISLFSYSNCTFHCAVPSVQ